jgi:hypothetical protein
MGLSVGGRTQISQNNYDRNPTTKAVGFFSRGCIKIKFHAKNAKIKRKERKSKYWILILCGFCALSSRSLREQ